MIRHKGLDKAETKIIKRSNGQWIDVTNRLTVQPVITQVVNNESTATFSVVNNIKNPARNLLSSACARWNNGYVGAIAESDIVTITYKNEELDIDQRLIRGIISTITCNQDTLEITVVDVIAELKKVGATYFRNHYLQGGYRDVAFNVTKNNDPQNTFFYVDKKGETADFDVVKFAKNETLPFPRTGTVILSQYGGSLPRYVEMLYKKGEFLGIMSISVYMEWAVNFSPGSVLVEIRENDATGTLIASKTVNVVTNATYYNIPINPSTTGVSTAETIYVKISAASPNDIKIGVRLEKKDDNNGNYRVENGNWMFGVLGFDAHASKFYDVIGTNTSLGTKSIFKIDTVDGVPLSDNDLLPEFERVKARFVSDADMIQAIDIVKDILIANNYSLSPDSKHALSSIDVNQFRCGGDFVHNYLLALSDLENDGKTWIGYQNVIATDMYNDKCIYFSRRMKNIKDAPRFKFSYAGDKLKDGSTWLKTFNPMKTMANRPVTSFIRGQNTDGTPIMIAVTDIERMMDKGVIDTSSIAFETNASNIIEAAKSAYADLMQYVNVVWEGSLELSGIHNAFVDNPNHRGYIDMDIGSETYGSGVPISITDSRYGMNDYRAIVTEVKYDFRDLTTKLMLNSYSIENSNVIKDNSKMALRAGNIATDAVNSNLYLQQYIMVRTSDNPFITGFTNSVQVRLSGSTILTSVAMTLYLPNLKMTVLSAHFPSNQAESVDDHGVEAVRYGDNSSWSSWIEIIPERRPDKMVGQSLTVNIQIYHP